ncbi:MAG: homocitrate synthase [Chloroflexi bacterium]|nr:MAG: homocitrate synthase [Chloroflexota bacterium]
MTIRAFKIIESTLREGEQFAPAHFTPAQKVAIAQMLDQFGVDYLELTSPCASPQSEADLRTVAALPLQAKVLTHVRCHLDDARVAVGTGADGIDVLFGTSSAMRAFSHGKTVDEIIETGTDVVRYIQSQGLEVRFSSEDSFRSEPRDLLRVYQAIDRLHPQRVGLADTVGIATPNQVFELVSMVRKAVDCDIEFHAHNDTGCAIANAFAALEAGATHIDTTVLGIGERNGIVPLSGMIARLLSVRPELVANYRLEILPELDRMVADMVGIEIPFNASITSETAFHHKAGMHTNAVLNDPSTYEIFDPARFGRQRTVMAGHRLTGRHAIASRATALGLTLTDHEVRSLTAEVKRRADAGPLSNDELDNLLRATPTLTLPHAGGGNLEESNGHAD